MIAAVRRHRFLLEQLVRRELRRKYQGSALGVAWYLVNPLVLMGAYWFLFGHVLKPVQHADYPLFLLVALAIWVFFSQSVLAAAPSLLEHGALIRKARFPRAAIPATVVTVQAIIAFVVLGLVAVLTVAVRGTLAPALLVLPVVLVALFCFVLGIGLAVAVLHAHLRDVAPILSAALLPWFFLSPVFFEPADVSDDAAARFALEWLNPVAPFIEAARRVLYDGALPGAATLAYVVVAAAVALAAGIAVFRALQRDLAVVV